MHIDTPEPYTLLIELFVLMWIFARQILRVHCTAKSHYKGAVKGQIEKQSSESLFVITFQLVNQNHLVNTAHKTATIASFC